MSVLVMTQVWALDVPHDEQSVLLALADHGDDYGGNVFPSMGYVAWKTGYSERQVYRIMAELRRRAVLVVTRAARGKYPAHYRLDLGKIPRKAPFVPKHSDSSPDVLTGYKAATASTTDNMSALPGGDAAGVTSATSTPDTAGQRADISGSTPDTAGQRADIAVSDKPSLVNRHLEPSLEPSRESPLRAGAREAPPDGARRTIDDPERTTCEVCGRPACIAGTKRSPPWAPFCSRACQGARARPNGHAEHAVLAAPASAELAVQARGSP